jgi:uncharacterized repeat protein (TIGR03806 family)
MSDNANLEERRFTPPPNPLPSRGGGARRVLLILALAASLLATAAARVVEHAPVNQAAIAAERAPELLSDYRFFTDAGAREANTGVTPYDLNTPLWSDGALKFRYLFLPPREPARYREEGAFEFPVGAVLIKTFAYPADMRRDTQNLRLLETRLLIRDAEGWTARVYVWNEAQTEARLARAGPDLPVSFLDADGAAIALDWDVPNENQCRGCHDRAGQLTPIGPTARNLNIADYMVIAAAVEPSRSQAPPEPINQLDDWSDRGLLIGAPRGGDAPRAPRAYLPASGSLDTRARAYLDVNCAHCHNPVGPAHTSGLDLSWSQHDPALWGVFKRPVAAGRASGGYDFAIEPGHPERSILQHRMQSDDPGVMMPELGRQLVDPRGTALVRDWIAAMDAQGRVSE